MLVVEVDVVGAKTCQGLIAAGFDVFWTSTDVEAAIITLQAEFGRENNFVAAIGDGTTNKTLIVSIAIDVGCIEKEDTKLYCSVDGFDGFVLRPRVRMIGTYPYSPDRGRRRLSLAGQVCG